MEKPQKARYILGCVEARRLCEFTTDIGTVRMWHIGNGAYGVVWRVNSMASQYADNRLR